MAGPGKESLASSAACTFITCRGELEEAEKAGQTDFFGIEVR
jgi:hypothetical protein